MQPELIADYQCECGENPLWHPDEGCLYWVDIPKGRLFRYFPKTGKHEQLCDGTDVGGAIGGFTIQEDGSLLLFMAKGAVKVWRNGKLAETIIEEIPDEVDSRFNDVIADPVGRVFCGTMATPSRPGRLYRLDPDGTLTKLLDGIGCSNGLGFTLDHTQLYYTDSPKHDIYMFDYDRSTGSISNQRLFVQTPDNEGSPDGMTVDSQGYIWTAKWDGSCLVRYTPEAREEQRIEFPTKKVSSLTFGGDDYTDIFVTTAGGDKISENGPGAGGLFHLNLGIAGVPEFRSKIKIGS